nr:MAG TPA: hypothetical protein [Caudoviricetes sp.]
MPLKINKLVVYVCKDIQICLYRKTYLYISLVIYVYLSKV